MQDLTENKAKELQDLLKISRSTLNNHTTNFIGIKGFLENCGKACKEWFQSLKPSLTLYNFNIEVLSKYDNLFNQLLRLSAGNNRTNSFKSCIKDILSKYQQEILLPIQTTKLVDTADSQIDELITKIQNADESEYLKEAVGCLKSGFNKASVVLGWCACISKIHTKIESVGFPAFNSTSNILAGQTQGRFKRFNKKYNITSLNELREVFDNDILWILEGMSLIDLNEHTRLKGCFDMRNHSAHPGNAPITKFNIMSFFSDLIEIVLSNPKFQ